MVYVGYMDVSAENRRHKSLLCRERADARDPEKVQDSTFSATFHVSTVLNGAARKTYQHDYGVPNTSTLKAPKKLVARSVRQFGVQAILPFAS